MNKTSKPIDAANSLSVMNKLNTELSPDKYPPHGILQAYFHQEIKTEHIILSKDRIIVTKPSGDIENDISQPSMPWLTEINDDYFKLRRPITNMKVLYSVVFSFFSLANTLLFFMMISDGSWRSFEIMALSLLDLFCFLYLLPLTVRHAYFKAQTLPALYGIQASVISL